MSYRHIEQIDQAVAVARRAVTVGQLDRPERLTRFLYRSWYLGLPSTRSSRPSRPPSPGVARRRGHRRAGPPGVPRAVPLRPPSRPEQVWQSWSASWTADHDRAGSDLVRLHLTCSPDTALLALMLVTERARAWTVPWRLSSTALNHEVPRADATVLHLPTEALRTLHDPLTGLLEELEPFLAGSVPALTLQVARGAALAQNPPDGTSFGEHRCGLVAQAVLRNPGYHHTEQVTRAMRAFADAGVDPRRPYVQAPASWDRDWAA